MKKLLGLLPLFAIAYLACLVFWGKNETIQAKTLPPITELWQVTKISDGDTLTVVNTDKKKLKIRFCGIDAPEKKQSLGKESTDLLTKLIKDSENQVVISRIEIDRYQRTVAEVFSFKPDGSEVFINEELVKNGLAYHYKQYSDNCPNRNVIALAENIAKSKKIGVWSGGHVPPWEYRKNKRRK